jgi:ribokinase
MHPCVVVGSINMDLVVRCPRLPRPGETVFASSFQTVPGGKGANQAVAIARLGGKVVLGGCLGNDDFGVRLREYLESVGVDTSGCRRVVHATGIASIWVDEGGQNSICVVPGANSLVTPALVEDIDGRLGPTLCQLEVPLDAVERALETAKGSRILNPAPARDPSDELLSKVDVLTPNEHEAKSLAGVAPTDEESCKEAASRLRDRGCGAVVITLGERGCYYSGPEGEFFVESIPVTAVDTTGAGDAFNGALAYFSQDRSMRRTLQLANRVAALSVTKEGAQPSMPTLDELRQVAGELL